MHRDNRFNRRVFKKSFFYRQKIYNCLILDRNVSLDKFKLNTSLVKLSCYQLYLKTSVGCEHLIHNARRDILPTLTRYLFTTQY